MGLTIEQTMKKLGFEHWDTGGGCTAYAREQKDKKTIWMVTAIGGCEKPVRFNQKVTAGTQDAETGAPLSMEFSGTLREFCTFIDLWDRCIIPCNNPDVVEMP